MKFTAFKEFRGQFLDSLGYVVDYLGTDLKKTLRELQLGLTKLSFSDNFESFTVEVTIQSGQELAIRNQLLNGIIPSQRLIVRGKSGAQNIIDGDTEWSRDFVYLKNTGASEVTATVIFLR